MIRRLAVVAVAGVCLLPAPAAASLAPVGSGAERVVIFTMPGVTWEEVAESRTPVLDRLASEGAVAAMSVRTAARRTDPDRGFLTLGAGNRANVRTGDVAPHLAFRADTSFEGGTAAEALARRTGRTEAGEIVHVGSAELDRRQDTLHYGTEIGSLGEMLARARIPRGIVSAADHSPEPQGTATLRRSSVLGLIDADGTVDHGVLDGLVRTQPHAPFGVATDPGAFDDAVREVLGRARVLIVEPGETWRADEYVAHVAGDRVTPLRRGALERADALLGRVAAALGPRDLLIVVAPSGPGGAPREQLTPLVIHGHGVEAGWLTTPSTRREGFAQLTDVAPTVLEALGADVPLAVTGTRAAVVGAEIDDAVQAMVDRNTAALFREGFVPVVVTVYMLLLFPLLIFSFLVFVMRLRAWRDPLVAVAFLLLAVPPATMLVRAFGLYTDLSAHLVLWTLAVAMTVVAWFLPGPRWSGGVALLLTTASILVVDAALGGGFQMNAIFGYSPIVAGRFYGFSNTAHPILYTAGILGLFALGDLRGRRLASWPTLGIIATLPLLVGLPMFGANFGGFISGIAGVAVAVALGRGWRIRWSALLGVGLVAVVLAAGLSMLDMARPPEVQTHLGRFAARVAEGGLPALQTVIVRKILANIGIIGLTAWTFMIPVGLAVVALLLARPRGVLRQVLGDHPLLRSGFIASMVMGVVGFAVNDSGVAVPGVMLAHVAPFLALVTADAHRDPSRPAGATTAAAPEFAES